jgi:hypothetical protein
MLSLREALPEKQSLKRGVATWAKELVNEKANRKERKRRRGMNWRAEGERDQVAQSPGQREKRKKDGKVNLITCRGHVF